MAYKSADFTYKRSQAQRNAESHIASLLYAAAKDIVALAGVYRTGIKNLSANNAFVDKAHDIAEKTQDKVEAYVTAYAEASAKILGVGNESVKTFMNEKVFGKTFADRNREYTRTFADDIIKMVSAAIQMGYTQSQILSAVRTGYKNPFAVSVITKARRKGIGIATPSYGKGYYHSAYQNIVRNAKGMISLAWAKALEEYAEEHGKGYFRVFRGSSYPCETCDYETSYIHELGKDPMPPYHVSCVCGIEFVDKEE